MMRRLGGIFRGLGAHAPMVREIAITSTLGGCALLAWALTPRDGVTPPLVDVVNTGLLVGATLGLLVLAARAAFDVMVQGRALRLLAPLNLLLVIATVSAVIRQNASDVDAFITGLLSDPGRAVAILTGLSIYFIAHGLLTPMFTAGAGGSSVAFNGRPLGHFARPSPWDAEVRVVDHDGPLSGKERWSTAVHEAGHFLTYAVLREPPSCLRIDIFADRPTNGARGRVMQREFSGVASSAVMEWLMLCNLAGAAAEKCVLGVFGPGSAQDMDKWSGYARLHLENGYGDAWFRKPADATERAINSASMANLKSRLMADLAEFMAANDGLLREIATTLQEVDSLQGARLTSYLERVAFTRAIARTNLSFTETPDGDDGPALRLGAIAE